MGHCTTGQYVEGLNSVSQTYVPALVPVGLEDTYKISISKNIWPHAEGTVTSFLPGDMVEATLWEVNNGHWIKKQLVCEAVCFLFCFVFSVKLFNETEDPQRPGHLCFWSEFFSF